jgi:hypothetical protein
MTDQPGLPPIMSPLQRRLLWFLDGATVVAACSWAGAGIGLHPHDPATLLSRLVWVFALVVQIAARRGAYWMAGRWRRIAELHEQKFQMLMEAVHQGVVVAIQASFADEPEEKRPSVH